ncbi:M14 family metallopeptidase [Nisaea acidiphila]|uniref:M14 family metallopeptidase n=1 Tax=Nisaea acidiphila TaxID=1862145 RepID=A0A9J7AVV0_9PROT|nr:M14 family metallopeptidase [Nisaea acidiphila]UUX49549.1 M14 family metallopeptidase [Nisaea acidiphila]
MSILEFLDHAFSKDYAEARERLLAAAKRDGAEVTTYENPNKGPNGETLACDAAWVGPKDAKKVLVTISATHGVEGFCGSGAQIDWFLSGARQGLGADMAALHIHALNPHGFAWLRRVTDEGCDLNRNYIDFSKPVPENPGHDELVGALVPPALDEATLKAAEDKIAAFRAKHGEKAFQAARKAGQYKHAHSMFFGGFGPSWARQTLEKIIEDFKLADRALVSVIDYHTGLGPFGYGEPICAHLPGSKGMQRVVEMYGDSVGVPELGTSSSIPLHGTSRELWNAKLGDDYTYVALEYGTYSTDRGRIALREDHWLHNQGEVDWNAPETKRIKEQIRNHYSPQMSDWYEMVLWRSRQIIRQTMIGLEKFG